MFLGRRQEIHSRNKNPQHKGWGSVWWPRAESNHRHADFLGLTEPLLGHGFIKALTGAEAFYFYKYSKQLYKKLCNSFLINLSTGEAMDLRTRITRLSFAAIPVVSALMLTVSSASSAPVPADANPQNWERFFLDRDLKEHSDLTFDPPVLYESNFNWQNKVFLPKGPGPFPLIVILPTCGGIDTSERNFLEYAITRGYAAFVMDNHRGARTNCLPNAQRPVKWGRLVKDLYDFAAYIRTQKVIDPSRLYSVGGSQGGMIGGLLASPGIKRFTAPEAPRYRATASLYGCGIYPLGTFKTQVTHTVYFFSDSDRPLLWLMGEDDKECMIDAELTMLRGFKDLKLPIEFHVYPGATHSWDHKNLDGKVKNFTYGGKSVSHTYKYNEEVTKDSYKRVIDFFDRNK
jgi:dienelactone hydrolase